MMDIGVAITSFPFLRIVAVACLCLAAPGCTKEGADSCQFKADAMLGMSFIAFDQGENGWRSLDNSIACSAYADDAIAAYRSRHEATLSPANRRLLMWHEAQVLAAQGETAEALQLMREATDGNEPNWQRLYKEATMAFLEGDLERLQASRERLAMVPADPTFKMADGSPVAWPPNLDVLDGLISCFGRPYSVAYSCRSQSEPGDGE